MDADRPFLERQLAAERYRLVLVAGRTALQWVEKAGLVRWVKVSRVAGPPSAVFYVGDIGGPLFVGWSCNLQSQHGAGRHVPSLIELVREHGLAALAEDGGREAGGRALPHGAHAQSLPRTRVAPGAVARGN